MADYPLEMRLILLAALISGGLTMGLLGEDKPNIGRPAKRPPKIQDFKLPKKQKPPRAKWKGARPKQLS